MNRVPSAVWAAVLFAALYSFFKYAIAPLTDSLTGTPAPLPASLVMMYTGLAGVAILLYLSTRDERWNAFVAPLLSFLRGSAPASRFGQAARRLLFILLPIAIGWRGYWSATVRPDPPSDPPGIHFNLPQKYLDVKNPLSWTDQNIREGGVLFVKNCAVCHGDGQDGNGMFARAWQPRPANFRDPGTIAQLPENYLYWRIKEGGPGLPRGSIEYRSAMPVWGEVLSEEQIWKIIMFEYTSAGQKPAKR